MYIFHIYIYIYLYIYIIPQVPDECLMCISVFVFVSYLKKIQIDANRPRF